MGRRIVLFGWLLAGAAWGQQRGMYGGTSTGQMVGTINDPGFAGRLGATVSGLPQTTTQIPVQRGIYSTPGHGVGWQQPRGGNRTVVVPYGYPVVYGGGFGGFGGFGGYDAPVQTIVQQPMQPSPAVIINQYYSPEVVRPQMKEFDDLPAPSRSHEREEEPKKQARVYPPSAVAPKPEPPKAAEAAPDAERATITLLAFNDSSVIAAIGYWIQEETLHFVTKGFEKRTAPLKSLDKALSEQLNKERSVEFKLEALR